MEGDTEVTATLCTVCTGLLATWLSSKATELVLAVGEGVRGAVLWPGGVVGADRLLVIDTGVLPFNKSFFKLS